MMWITGCRRNNRSSTPIHHWGHAVTGWPMAMHEPIEPPPGGYMFHISQMFFPRFFRKSYWRGANKIPGVHEPRRGLTFTILYYFILKMSRHSNLEEIFFQWPC